MRNKKLFIPIVAVVVLLAWIMIPRTVQTPENVPGEERRYAPAQSDDEQEIESEGNDEQEEAESTEDSEQEEVESSGDGEPEEVGSSEEGEPEEAEAVIIQIREAFKEMIAKQKIYGVIYQCVSTDIKAHADVDSQTLVSAYSGRQVNFLDVEFVDGILWYKVEIEVDGTNYVGYIMDQYIISPYDAFDQWKENALKLIAANQPKNRSGLSSDPNFEAQIQVFPESYRPYLRQLYVAHPNWIFVANLTKLKWTDVIREEKLHERNLIENSVIASWKSAATADYNVAKGQWIVKSEPNWMQASEGIIKHYMDARNFLNNEGIFQFETLTYNPGVHTVAGVNAILSGTFMASTQIPDDTGKNISYAQAFMKIAAEIDVSPYLLASRVRQEQGAAGTSDLISGKFPGYEGYYNYFNIQAYGLTYNEIVKTGLTEAKKNGWNTRYKSLLGGAKRLSSNYIAKGQNTLYLQKFHVDSSDGTLYWRQYMQNLRAPQSEAKSVKKAYDAMGLTNSKFIFKIPVFVSLPEKTISAPTKIETKPTTITSVSQAADKIEIKWNAVAGADGYRLLCSTSESSGYVNIATCNGQSNIKYLDAGKKSGTKYYYKVAPFVLIDNDPLQAVASKAMPGILNVAPAPKLAKPKIGSCSSTNSKSIKVTWGKVAGASGYQLFRATSKNGTYKAVKTLSQLNFTNTALQTGTMYYFKVRAYVNYNGSKVYSPYSDIRAKKAMPLATKITRIDSNSKRTIRLQWAKVPDASGYFVYRATSKSGTYKRIKTLGKNTLISFTDKKLTSKRTYYYKVRSYKIAGKVKVPSYFSAIKGKKVR